MKTKVINKFLLPVLMVLLMPALASAHPGHEHSGGFWDTFTHFLFTYYIYIILSMVFIAGIFRYLYLLKSQNKQKAISSTEKKE